MKKGDIVRLKQNTPSLQAASIHRFVSGQPAQQEFYTVKDSPSYKNTGCGGEVEMVMTLEEAPGKYNYFLPEFFDVVLKNGEPDISELMSPLELVEKA